MKNTLLIILLIVVYHCAIAQKNKLYTQADGLSNASFTGFAQDEKDNIWIATGGGVNKFDGYNFEVFANNPLDTNSFRSNLMDCIFSDSQGRLWAGSSNGLYYFNAQKNNFEIYPLILDGNIVYPKVLDIVEGTNNTLWLGTTLGLISVNPKTGKTDFKHPVAAKTQNRKLDPINVLKVDKSGNLWIGTDGYGLRYYNPVTDKSISYKTDPNNINSLSDNLILSLLIDSKGNVIIGTIKGGISIYNPKEHSFKTIPLFNKPGNKFNGGIYSIIEDRKGIIWVGTERNGIKILDVQSLILADANHLIDVEELKDSKVLCYQDKDENLWLGIEYKGIYLKKAITKPFHSFEKNKTPKGLSHDIVKCILEDSEGNLLIGTDGGGLNVISGKDKTTKVYQHNPNDKKSIADNAIITIFEDKRKNIWIGSYLGGLSLFNKKYGTFINYSNDSIKEGSNYNFFTSIIEDDNSNLWIGTMAVGLYHFDVASKRFTNFQRVQINGKWIELPRYINKLCKDKDNGLWIASYNGLCYLNQKKGLVKFYTRANKRLKSDEVYDVLQDSGGNIWVATSYGIHVLNEGKGTNIHYDIGNGLSSNRVYGLVEDPRKHMWISTDNGLCRFSFKDKTFIKYFRQDGLQGNEFLPASHFKGQDGKLYFGSTSGVVYFYPDSIEESQKCPQLILSSLKLFNKEVRIGKQKDGSVILDKPLDEAGSIDLEYSDNSFTIEFAAIDFNVPEKIKYAYQMEGFDNNWIIKNHNERNATYTNLNPGTYTFKVKCTNSDGVWSSNIKSIQVIISPPWWRTWWANSLYFLLIIAALYFTRRLMLMRWQMKNELHLERLEREKREEINQSKLRFFTNISHEFRTPLTLILAPVENLLSNETPAIRKNVKLIHTNALRLLRMFNQLLELQKLEENKMELNAQPGNLVEFIKNIAEPFVEVCNDKGISLEVHVPENPIVIWFDFDKLDKVLFNLLSNAFKFTPANGKISVRLHEVVKDQLSEGYVEIVIEDTGIGINKDYYEKIFHRFYQVEHKDSKTSQGTGIGLHLAQSLVQLHKGEITVESEEGRGSTFTIKLPFDIGNHNDYIAATSATGNQPIHKKEEIVSVIDTAEDVQIRHDGNKENYKVLIVDDDKQILNFLRSELYENYNVLEALNGKEALSVAQRELPDLIISDIMMPEMDGIEFCKEIKLDINTCHIPVILLTAKSAIESRIEGLQTGADSYIPKPFHLNHLKTRIQKLIELRENLKKKFSRSINFDAKEMTLMSADEKFLQKAVEFVRENISDSELNIEDMGKQLGMSRAQLYRKIKSLTDQSPSEFVRTIRLKQAAYLLSQNKLNISEVAYQVGFNSPQYFTNSFREYYNMSPSEYCQKSKVEMK